MSHKLLVIAPSAYPLGGVAVWLEYLLPGLKALDFECTLGLVAGKFHDINRYMCGRPPVQVVGIQSPTGSSEGRRRRLAECIESTRPNVILGVNIADVYPALRRVRGKDGDRPKVIMTLHGIEADLFADMKANADLIDGVIASNRLACALSATVGGMDSSRVHYAPYGVALHPPDGASDWAPAGSVRIAWVGRFEQDQKRVFDIEPVLDQLALSDTPCTLRMVGDGPDRAELESRLRRFATDGRVDWAGAVPSAEMTSRVYRSADALLVTSTWETGPIIIWEAMAAGVPVVSSRYTGSGLEGALKDGENCLLFDVGDAVGAADAIRRLQDPTLRARLVESGLDLVRRRYSVEASVSAWRASIEAVLHAPPRHCLGEVPVAPGGRLDRWLGVSRAESLRSWLGISYPHVDAGGEWPHTMSPSTAREELWRMAHSLDFMKNADG